MTTREQIEEILRHGVVAIVPMGAISPAVGYEVALTELLTLLSSEVKKAVEGILDKFEKEVRSFDYIEGNDMLDGVDDIIAKERASLTNPPKDNA